MTSFTVFQLSRDRLVSLRTALDTVGLQPNPEIVRREMEELVADGLTLPGLIRRLWHFTFDMVASGQIKDYDREGKYLLWVLDQALQTLQRSQEQATEVEQLAGKPVARREELTEAIAVIRRLRDYVAENWFWEMTKEEWAEAIAEMERTGGVDADEAFAQIAGVSKEEWRHRVEEHKRKYHHEGV